MPDDARWVMALAAADIEQHGVARWDHEGKSYAIVRTADDQFFALSDICTHEFARMSDGLVMGDSIECPRHFAAFDLRTGEPMSPPACTRLKTFPTRHDNGTIFIQTE